MKRIVYLAAMAMPAGSLVDGSEDRLRGGRDLMNALPWSSAMLNTDQVVEPMESEKIQTTGFVRDEDWGAFNTREVDDVVVVQHSERTNQGNHQDHHPSTTQEYDPWTPEMTCGGESGLGMCQVGYHCECSCEDPLQSGEICEVGTLCDDDRPCCTTLASSGRPTCATCGDCTYPQIVEDSCCIRIARRWMSNDVCCKCGANRFKFVTDRNDCEKCDDDHPPSNTTIPSVPESTSMPGTTSTIPLPETTSASVVTTTHPQATSVPSNATRPETTASPPETSTTTTTTTSAKITTTSTTAAAAATTTTSTTSPPETTNTTTSSTTTTTTTTLSSSVNNSKDVCKKPDGSFAGNLGDTCDTSLTVPFVESPSSMVVACCLSSLDDDDEAATCVTCDLCNDYQIVTVDCCSEDDDGGGGNDEDDSCNYCCKTKSGFKCVESEKDCVKPRFECDGMYGYICDEASSSSASSAAGAGTTAANQEIHVCCTNIVAGDEGSRIPNTCSPCSSCETDDAGAYPSACCAPPHMAVGHPFPCQLGKKCCLDGSSSSSTFRCMDECE